MARLKSRKPQKSETMKLCDIHTHVLPGVDDGAPTMEYALQMLENAAASDVELLVVTPHCNSPFGDGNYLEQSLQERFLQLQQAAEEIPVRLALGAEVHVNDRLLTYLEQGKLPTINGSRYLLTEFSPSTEPEDFQPVLQGILELGYVPLVAHPERYEAVCKTPQIVLPWLDMGCHIQLTGGSVLGEFGRSVQKTAVSLLRNDLVACVASDAHGVNYRSNFLLDIYDHLRVQYSKQYAQSLLYENPMGICHDEVL